MYIMTVRTGPQKYIITMVNNGFYALFSIMMGHIGSDVPSDTGGIT